MSSGGTTSLFAGLLEGFERGRGTASERKLKQKQLELEKTRADTAAAQESMNSMMQMVNMSTAISREKREADSAKDRTRLTEFRLHQLPILQGMKDKDAAIAKLMESRGLYDTDSYAFYNDLNGLNMGWDAIQAGMGVPSELMGRPAGGQQPIGLNKGAINSALMGAMPSASIPYGGTAGAQREVALAKVPLEQSQVKATDALADSRSLDNQLKRLVMDYRVRNEKDKSVKTEAMIDQINENINLMHSTERFRDAMVANAGARVAIAQGMLKLHKQAMEDTERYRNEMLQLDKGKLRLSEDQFAKRFGTEMGALQGRLTSESRQYDTEISKERSQLEMLSIAHNMSDDDINGSNMTDVAKAQLRQLAKDFDDPTYGYLATRKKIVDLTQRQAEADHGAAQLNKYLNDYITTTTSGGRPNSEQTDAARSAAAEKEKSTKAVLDKINKAAQVGLPYKQAEIEKMLGITHTPPISNPVSHTTPAIKPANPMAKGNTVQPYKKKTQEKNKVQKLLDAYGVP
jgi:hypothetical protein